MMPKIIQLNDLDFTNKRILLREDYNVPLKNFQVDDDSRLEATLPTIRQLLEANAAIIILSHLGRPIAGKYNEELSLAPIANALSKLLDKPVPLIKDWVNGVHIELGEIVLCENVRFEVGEEEDDDELSRKMAALCQLYVNDAFATAHRAQASTSGVTKYVPISCAGPLLYTELKNLARILNEPEQPLIAIVGGSKISTKLNCLHALLKHAQQLIVGGGIANTLLLASGHKIGRSLHEPALLGNAKKILASAEEHNCKILLPKDVVCAKILSDTATAEIKSVTEIVQDDLILDVGPESTAYYAEYIEQAKTVVWNGPLGVFEYPRFSTGTRFLAETIANNPAFSLAGGGETLSAIKKFGLTDKISYLSTGGGAFLQYIEGKKLPAINMLEESAYAWAAMEQAREY